MSVMEVYRYHAFGMQIESSFPLGGYLPGVGAADVIVREGSVPVTFPGPPGENSFVVERPGSFAYRIKEIASYLIQDGREVIVEKDERSVDHAFSSFFSGTCIGALLLQRGKLPIHGSALLIDGKGIIVTGQSGAGKSTVTASLNKLGYEFLADDIAALELEDTEGATIYPGFPIQRLWRDTATRIFGGVETFERIPGIRDKFNIPIPPEQFVTSNRKLHALFELLPADCAAVEVEELRGAEKITRVINNTYWYDLVNVMGLREWHFAQCARIANQIRVFRVRRPLHGFTTDEQIRGMLEALHK
ncbi:hypothetical protein [Paenibacillus soyae]|uniref:HPr kinase n=1 Tax=Paenibacillus soyae TaxID=2969249 RepID=A0A9X2MWX6_9BACL|nr:hypothetical protein [Paenibacillus soyae]MCR2807408.1 hypothetical protein [Paenibacillus soyae]